MSYDLIRWASHLSVLLAASFVGCFLMMPDKRSPAALLLLGLSLATVLLVVLHVQDGRTMIQYLLSAALLR